MNKNVKPLHAVIVVFIAVVVFSFKFWAFEEAVRVAGPNQMKHDNAGDLYIHLDNTLYKLSPTMALVDKYDLADYGVSQLVGDFDFFANGDVLFRRGHYDPTFVDNILMFLRLSSLKAPTIAAGGEGLVRCNLETKVCENFGQGLQDFDRPHHISIDRETDTVYLTDTPQHTVYKFDGDGRQLAEQRQGYRFPNQISYIDSHLYIADTNHHRIQLAGAGTDDFAHIQTGYDVTDKTLDNRTWVYSFARVGDGWWVNNMDASMSRGYVALFDGTWRFRNKLEMPEKADPMDISSQGDYVVITDAENIDIYAFDAQGRQQEIALPSAMLDRLVELRDTKRHYLDLEQLANVLLMVFLVVGFVFAYLQARSQDDPALFKRSEKIRIDPRDPSVNWVAKNSQRMTLIWIGYGALVVLFLLSGIGIYTAIPDAEFAPVLFVTPAMILFAFVVLRKQMSIQIGYIGDLIVIKNAGNKYSVGKGDRIYYSDNIILIDDVYIQFNSRNSLFHTEDIVKQIMPRLKDANYVKQGEMMNMVIKRTDGKVLLAVLAAIAVLFYLAITDSLA